LSGYALHATGSVIVAKPTYEELEALLLHALEAMENYGRRGGAEERIARRIRQQLSPDQ